MAAIAASAARKDRRLRAWERSDVPYCSCPALSYKHTHCPCEECLGKAVSRSTEFRHWNAARKANVVTQTQVSSEPRSNRDDTGSSTHEVVHTDELDLEHGDTSNSEPSQLQPSRLHPATATTTEHNRDDVTWGVVKAFQLMEDMDASQQDYLHILKFGEELYNRGRGESDSHWPRTWQEAQALLHEAGLQDPKTYYICLD